MKNKIIDAAKKSGIVMLFAFYFGAFCAIFIGAGSTGNSLLLWVCVPLIGAVAFTMNMLGWF